MKKRSILISIHPEHVNNILNGEKTFEYRKTIPKSEIDEIIIYSTSPTMKIVAISEVRSIHSAPPKSIWKMTKDKSGIRKSFFDVYFSRKNTAHAIELGKTKVFKNQICLSELQPTMKAPQSFQYLNDSTLALIQTLGNYG